MLSYFKRVFSLDYRSLALLRIAVGLTLFFDVIQRAMSIRAHYSDAGVLPRSELFRLWNESTFWSLYHINGTALFAGILLTVAGIFALMLIVGYRTRIALFTSFILLVSVHNRNPLVLQGGDVALRVILFWMMFLPLGKRYSIDGVISKESLPKTKEYSSVFSAAYVLQFLAIWAFSGLLKTGAPWVSTHTAVAMALSLDTFTTNFGYWLKQFPNLLKYLTVVTLLIEKYVWAFFVLPKHTGWLRILGIGLFSILIIGFNLSMRLGLFGMIMISISLGMLPGVFWDKIVLPFHKWLSLKSDPGLTIFYDGDCSFCSRISNATRAILFLHPDTKIMMSQKDESAKSIMHSAHSWVVRDPNGFSYTGFRAFVALMQSAFFYRIFASIFLFKPLLYIGEKIYRFVAHNRPMVCVTQDFFDPNRLNKNKWFIFKKYLVGILIALVLLWNFNTLDKSKDRLNNTIIEKALTVLRLDQKWNMFAPYPADRDGFQVIPGNLRDGTVVNVYNGLEYISYDKPENTAWIFENQRWQKYLMNLWLDNFSDYRLGYGRYLCRQWNQHNPYEKNLIDFKIVYVMERTDPNTAKESEPEKITLWEHYCFK